MSLYTSELVIYGSAHMPEADSATIGGLPDFTKRVGFSDLTSTGPLAYVSSASADNATIVKMTGRDSTGAIQTETVTLNGTTPVNGTQNFQRLLYSACSGASSGGPIANPGGVTATGDVAAYSQSAVLANRTPQSPYSANASGTTPPLLYLQAGDGATVNINNVVRITAGTGAGQIRYIVDNTRYGTDIAAVNRDWTTPLDATSRYTVNQGMVFEIAPNQVTAIIRPFATASAQASGGSTNTYYEKVFVANNDTATSLTSATITIQLENPTLPGSSALDIALTTILDDNATSANRQTLPTNQGGGALTWTSGSPPQTQNVPSPGNLPSGAAPNTAGAQAVWIRLTLPAGTVPYQGLFDLRPAGVST